MDSLSFCLGQSRDFFQPFTERKIIASKQDLKLNFIVKVRIAGQFLEMEIDQFRFDAPGNAVDYE
jgi:hypothetical protein